MNASVEDIRPGDDTSPSGTAQDAGPEGVGAGDLDDHAHDYTLGTVCRVAGCGREMPLWLVQATYAQHRVEAAADARSSWWSSVPRPVRWAVGSVAFSAVGTLITHVMLAGAGHLTGGGIGH